MDGVRIWAPAKVNLYLGVGALRSDGYHEVETVLQAIDLCDELSIAESSSLGLTCEPPLDVPAEENLAWRAATALAQELGREPAVAITLNKRIPAGAGLGGGSSDAAAVLAGLAALWNVSNSDPRLMTVAARLGADVPFFLGAGGGTARFTGKGDVLAESLPTPRFDVIVLKPAAGISTARAYSAFDHAPVPPPGPETLISALRSRRNEEVVPAISNNMEDAASALVAQVADALAWLRELPGVMSATVAGSGSAVFGLCPDAVASQTAAQRAIERGFWAVATTTRDRTVQVERMCETG